MSQRKTLRKFSEQRLGLHRRQLFHWIGSDLEKDRKLSAKARAEKYLEYLWDSLRDGLWLKLPRLEENLGGNGDFKLKLPICCFTETTLDEVEFHNREYGRLGLGFPKRFVLSNGGKPVNYVNDVKADLNFQAWLSLKQKLHDERFKEVFSESERTSMLEEFEYLCHFLKCLKEPYFSRGKLSKPKVGRIKSESDLVSKRKKSETFKRNYGGILKYLEEREWRIVTKLRGKNAWPKNLSRNTKGSMPPYFLPYKVSKDLFTVVFPDNRTLAMALDDHQIRSLLQPSNATPVTLLSLEDLGTF